MNLGKSGMILGLILVESGMNLGSSWAGSRMGLEQIWDDPGIDPG